MDLRWWRRSPWRRRHRRAGVVVVGTTPGQPLTIDELEAMFVDVGGRSGGVRLVVLADPSTFFGDGSPGPGHDDPDVVVE